MLNDSRKESIGGAIWNYKRGWSFVALVLSGGNALVLWYTGLGFSLFFDTIFAFALVFAPVVAIGSWIIGRVDIDRGTYGGETERAYSNIPFFKNIAASVNSLEERLTRIENLLEDIKNGTDK